jgi:hypothetical protein
MTGAASLIREALSLFFPNKVPGSAAFSLSFLGCSLVACFMVIRLQRREIGALKARIAPKLKIQNLLRREFPNPQNPNGVEYFFEVFNQSEATSVQNVTVRLIKLSPDVLQYLPVALHLKHDNPLDPRQFATEFDLGPLQIKHVDLLTGPIPSPLRRPVLIEHVVVDVKVPITLQRFRMTVEASGRDVRPYTAHFEAWMDESGSLQCVEL